MFFKVYLNVLIKNSILLVFSIYVYEGSGTYIISKTLNTDPNYFFGSTTMVISLVTHSLLKRLKQRFLWPLNCNE